MYEYACHEGNYGMEGIWPVPAPRSGSDEPLGRAPGTCVTLWRAA